MQSKVVTDQMGHHMQVPSNPQCIISLVPSQTELLFDLGLSSEIKGITKFCVHPAERVKTVNKIGGTKNFNFDAIDQLQPDLIIGNKEENYRAGIENLRAKYPVWMSDVYDLQDAMSMIGSVAHLVNRLTEGEKIVESIKKSFAVLKSKDSKRVLYFIWQRPFMVAGKDTFIDEMLSKLGLQNAMVESRYPEVSTEQIEKLDPQLILLSSEPFPFKAKHMNAFKAMCPNAEVYIVDGEMFSWYGSRLLKAPDYFNSLRF